ncbi:MAG: Gfo/Idh/MocA family oxidoreductase, partial [Candidatus Omnitrophica bacterium]|nr:Gfo/Idh/MocA family oxidoreductase [Candidatus Omnitrophota bacterium]
IKTYNSYEELLEDKEIDFVYIPLPNHLHLEWIEKSAKKGKHILCEKPLALTLEDCQAIVTAAKKSQGKFMIGQVCRFAPAFSLTKNLIESGEIGELFFVESEYAHDYRVAPGVGHWRKDPARPREPFIGGGCHAVDLLRWIAGDPLEVFAYANHKCLPDWPVNDALIAIYKFPNEVMGKVFCSIGCVRPYTMRSVFYGTKGTIISDNTSSFIQICSTKYFPTKGEYAFASVPVKTASHNVEQEVAYFVDCILNEKQVEMDAIEGSKTVAACLAAVISVRENRKVEVPSVYQGLF